MALTSDEKVQLQKCSALSLNRNKRETILRRSLTEREWKSYNHDYRAIFSEVAKHASNVAARKFKVRNVQPTDESIKFLRIEKE